MTYSDNVAEFNDWCLSQDIDLRVGGPEFLLGEERCVILPDAPRVLGEDLSLHSVPEGEYDRYVFRFGLDFYHRTDPTAPTLDYFSVVGEPLRSHRPILPLGLSDEYALDGTVGRVGDYLDKAAWLGAESVGYAARNSCAGLYTFQVAAEARGLKPILGVCLDVVVRGVTTAIRFYAVEAGSERRLIRLVNERNLADPQELTLEGALPFLRGLRAFLPVDGATSGLHLDELRGVAAALREATGHRVRVYAHTDRYADARADGAYYEALGYYWDVLRGEFPLELIEAPAHCHPQHYMAPLHLRGIEKATGTFAVGSHLKSEVASFRDYPIPAEGFSRADWSAVAARIETGVTHLPQFPTEHPGGQDAHLKDDVAAAYKKLVAGMPKERRDVYRARVREEVGVVTEYGLSGYFLLLAECLRHCRDRGIPTGPGRGSSAGSLVCFLLGITRVDPVVHDLSFGRFLNVGRLGEKLRDGTGRVTMLKGGSPPDVDSDLSVGRRHEAVDFLRARYGDWCVCSAGTYTTLKHLAATKAVFRSAGLSFDRQQKISQAFPKYGPSDVVPFEEAWRVAVGSKPFYSAMQAYPDHVRTLQATWGQAYVRSVHPCAKLVYTSGDGTDLRDVVPMRWSGGELISEWEGGSIEGAGLLKLDLLGLSQLDKLAAMAAMLEAETGEPVDPISVDVHDDDVYRLFAKGVTQDVFQFSSEGVVKLCRRARPHRFGHLEAIAALYRPGPMAADAHNVWADCVRGVREPDRSTKLYEFTRETQGVLVYQETMLRIFREVGGFTPEEADRARAATGKKKVDLILPFGEKFLKNAVEVAGWGEGDARALWDQIVAFAAYAFVKAHAAAYAHLAACAMWFKAKHPLYFYAVAIEQAGQDDLPAIIYEIDKHGGGIKIVPPDVNVSGRSVVPDVGAGVIYWSLPRIKGVGEATVRAILAEREARGPFESLTDFVSRLKGTGVGAGVAEVLVKAGAFDNVYGIKSLQERRKIVATLYRRGLRKNVPPEMKHPRTQRPTYWSLLQRSLLGFGELKLGSLADRIGGKLARRLVSVERAMQLRASEPAAVAGVITSIKAKVTKKGKDYGLIRLDSGAGSMECYLWGEMYTDNREALQDAKRDGAAVVISGSIGGFRDTNTIGVNEQGAIFIDD